MAKTIHILGEGGTIFAMDLPLHEAIDIVSRRGT